MMSVWHRAFRLLVFTHLLSWGCFFFLTNSCSELPMYRAIGHYSYISLKNWELWLLIYPAAQLNTAWMLQIPCLSFWAEGSKSLRKERAAATVYSTEELRNMILLLGYGKEIENRKGVCRTERSFLIISSSPARLAALSFRCCFLLV